VDKKITSYVCSGCGIGDAIDVEALAKVVEEECGVDSCKIHAMLCGPEGTALIRKDIEDGTNSIVLGACSPRAMECAFTFDGAFVNRANLREQVAWAHEPNDEDTQMLAEDCMRMYAARAAKGEVPTPCDEPVDHSIMVVGGGITGMSAALDAANVGLPVHLVEKAAELGGWAAKQHKSFPRKAPWRDLEPNTAQDVVEQVLAHDKITVHTTTRILKISGQPGQFDVEIENGEGKEAFRVGALIQATGWKPYDASKIEHLSYADSADIITNVEMEELAAKGPIVRPSDGKPAKRVAFIQCAGSRDEDHLPYCSAVCCRVSLKQAMYVREQDADAKVFVLYKDLRSPAQFEDFYRRVQEDEGIFFTKGDVTGVTAKSDGALTVVAENTLLGENVTVEADLVVLACGMVPVAADGEAIRQVVDAKAIIAKGESPVQIEAAEATLTELGHHEGTEILNLDYRQGPDLPSLKYGMPDSHFICFPYETRRTGIYAAGGMRMPADTILCQEDAAGAALKAIQCLKLTEQGKAVHPRWEDASFTDFNFQRCTQCKRCTEECPFGALNEDVKGTPELNLTRCRRCGICLGGCPERIIGFKDYHIDLISSMIKAVDIPDEEEEKPRILVFVCENDAYPALDRAGVMRLKYSSYFRIIPVRCIGATNTVWIADALSSGFDGILLVGCQSGDDYQCHMIRGSELTKTRSSNVKEKLEQLALENERVRIEEVAINEAERFAEILNEFSEEIEELGPNPFKGF
jgi:quinone-modifying oxidoreductase, subunit QmoB